jgi:hypothetical protein
MYPSRMILSNQEDHKGVPPYRLPRFRDDARESTEPNHAKQEATNSNGKFPDDVNRRDKCSCGKDIETSEYTSRNMQRVGVSCFL